MATKTTTMRDQQSQRFEKAGQWVRTGIVSVSLLKPVIETLQTNWNKRNKPVKINSLKSKFDQPVEALGNARAKIVEQIPLTQAQLDGLAKEISARLGDVSNQAKGFAGRAAKYPGNVSRRMWWASGISLGFGVAAFATFLIARRRMAQQQQANDLVMLPSTNGQVRWQDGPRGIVGRLTNRRAQTDADGLNTSTDHSTATATEVDVVSQAKFIGNIRTMVYHASDSERLPAEEHRVYFLSEQEAEDAGYRPATGE